MRYSFLIFICFISISYGQKVTSFYEQLHQFNYPETPLPNTCEIYGYTSNLLKTSMFTYDYRGEVLRLHKLKATPATYGFGIQEDELIPKLFAFDKYHKKEVPFENGFLVSTDVSDIEFYHKKNGKTAGQYAIYYRYSVRFSITHKDEILTEKTYEYDEYAQEFSTELRGEDVHIVATNKTTELAKDFNDTVLKRVSWVIKKYLKETIDLSFRREYIKFYGLTKLKKISVGEEIKALQRRLKELKKIDQEIENRAGYQTELQALGEALEHFKSASEYRNLEPFRFYIHANLASIYTLKEQYEQANEHYDIAARHTDKLRFQNIIKEEQDKMQPKWKSKENLFQSITAFSPKYQTVLETKKRVIN